MIGQWRRTRDRAQQLPLSVKTVEYYRHRIKDKLALKNLTARTCNHGWLPLASAPYA